MRFATPSNLPIFQSEQLTASPGPTRTHLVGNYCYDNAAMERFFWSLKHEWTKHEEYADLEETRLSVFRYIETFYNSERLHQTLNYQSPDQFESKYAQQLAG